MADKKGKVLKFPGNKIKNKASGAKSLGKALKAAFSVIIVIFVICCVGAVVIMSNDESSGIFYRFTNYYSVDKGEQGLNTVYEFQSDAGNVYGVLDNSLILASPTDIKLYNRNGEDVFSHEADMQSPAVAVNGKVAAVYDLKGSRLYVFTGIRDIMDYVSRGEILSVSVSEGGYVAVTSIESGYKSAINVFDRRGDLAYNCGYTSGYVTATGVSPNGKSLAAALTYQENGTVISRVDMYSMEAPGIVASYTISDELIINVSFLNKKTICCVCESRLVFLNADTLDYIGEYLYGGLYLKDFSFGADDRVILLFNQYKGGGKCSIISVDDLGNKTGERSTDGDVASLDAAGSTVVTLEDTRVVVMDKDLDTSAVLSDVNGYKKVGVRADSSVILVGSSDAALYIR